MQNRLRSLLTVSAVFLTVSGCTGKPDRRAPAPIAAAPATSQPHLKTIVEFDRQTLVFKPTRDDFTVGCAVLNIFPHRMEAVRVNGAPIHIARVYLNEVRKNEFELPPLKIELADDPDAMLCISVKAYFNEATNQNDTRFYQALGDRYSLLSWCSREAHNNTESNARMRYNPVATIEAFKAGLRRPFVIRLNDEPLRPEYSKHPMISAGLGIGDDDLKAIEKVVRDAGEQYVITISTSDRRSMLVSVGDASYFRSARIYTLAKKDGVWEIEKVERARE